MYVCVCVCARARAFVCVRTQFVYGRQPLTCTSFDGFCRFGRQFFNLFVAWWYNPFLVTVFPLLTHTHTPSPPSLSPPPPPLPLSLSLSHAIMTCMSGGGRKSSRARKRHCSTHSRRCINTHTSSSHTHKSSSREQGSSIDQHTHAAA